MPSKKGYLIITMHDQDEVDATFITDKKFFEKIRDLSNRKNGETFTDVNEQVINMWTTYQNTHPKMKRFFAQAPGNYKWPFNGLEIQDTYCILVY